MRFRSYISLLLALALIVGPWMQPPKAEAASEDHYCDCCQGPCLGCCCSVPDEEPAAIPDQSDDGCQCNMSSMPATPETPVAIQTQRTDNESAKISEVEFVDIEALPELTGHFSNGNYPPRGKSPPAYLLFGAFLI